LTRDEEIAAIERFITSHGVTIGPVVFVAPTSTGFSSAEVSGRLEAIEVQQKLTKQEMRAAAHRFYMSLRP
jgi:hypothetical protein